MTVRRRRTNFIVESAARRFWRTLWTFSALCVAANAHASHTCTVGVGTVNFGAYTGVQKNTTATMTVTCTLVGNTNESTTFTATLSTGVGTYAQRLLTHSVAPPDTLNYNLYVASVPATLNTAPWGDGSGTTATWTSSLAMTTSARVKTATNTVAAAIAAAAVLPTAGTYSDSIIATITYN